MVSKYIRFDPEPQDSGGNTTSNNAGDGNGFFNFMNQLMPLLGQAIPLGLSTYAGLQNPQAVLDNQAQFQKMQAEQQAAQQRQQFYIFGGIFVLIFIMMMVFIFREKK